MNILKKLHNIFGTSDHTYFSKNHLDMEDFLLYIAKYPIMWSRCIGYLPLSIHKSPIDGTREFRFSLLSFPVILCVLQSVVLTAIVYFWQAVEARFTRVLAKHDSDGWLMKALAYTVLFNTLLYRVGNLIYSKKSLAFWKLNCFQMKKYFLEDFHLPNYQKILFQLHAYPRNCLLFLCTFTVLSHSFLVVLELALQYFDLTDEGVASLTVSGSVSVTALAISWFFFNLCHPPAITWVIFFLKLYSVCLSIVSSKIRALHEDNEEVSPLLNTASKCQFISIQRVTNSGSGAEAVKKETLKRNFCEQGLSECIDMYKAVDGLLKEFHSHFGGRLVLEICHNMALCLGFAYFTLAWVDHGSYISALTNILPLGLYVTVFLNLGIIGSLLSSKTGEVLESLHGLPMHKMSEEMQWKVL
jgi:hypothetical protein